MENSSIFKIVDIGAKVIGFIVVILSLQKANGELEIINNKAESEQFIAAQNKYMAEQQRQEMFFKMYDKMSAILKSKDSSDMISFQEVVKELANDESTGINRSININGKDSTHNYFLVFQKIIENDKRFPLSARENAGKEITLQTITASAQAVDNNLSKSINVKSKENSSQVKSSKILVANVDIFYLDDNSNFVRDREDKAQRIAFSLDEKRYNPRVRPLLKITNERFGYRVVQNELRYNPKDPNETTLKDSILRKIPIEFGVKTKSIQMSTPGYLSVFIVK